MTEQEIRNKIYEEVRQLLADSDIYIGHNAYLPGHIVLKVIKGSND